MSNLAVAQDSRELRLLDGGGDEVPDLVMDLGSTSAGSLRIVSVCLRPTCGSSVSVHR